MSMPHARLCVLLLSSQAALAGSCSATGGDAWSAAMHGYPLDADYALAATTYDTGLYGFDALYRAPLPASAIDDPLDAIRAAADGVSDMCPGAVTVEPRLTRTPCAADAAPALSGVTLTFNQCQLGNGGVLDGTLDSAATHTASDDTCDSRTAITVVYSATFSNFSYVAPSGKATVLRSLDAHGRFIHVIGELPRNIAAEISARVQRYDADKQLTSDRLLSGTLSATLSHARLTTSTDAMLSASNAIDGSSASIRVEGLQYEASCCHAIIGRVGVTGDESQSVDFGPGCGEATRDGRAIALGECP